MLAAREDEPSLLDGADLPRLRLVGLDRDAAAELVGSMPAEVADRLYRATAGNLSAQIWRRVVEGRADFLTVTLWDSYDAIRRFAGDDIDKPVYYPEDGEYLIEFEPAVAHYEVVAQAQDPDRGLEAENHVHSA